MSCIFGLPTLVRCDYSTFIAQNLDLGGTEWSDGPKSINIHEKAKCEQYENRQSIVTIQISEKSAKIRDFQLFC